MANKKIRSVVSFSGGMDSATVLSVAKDAGDVVGVIGFTYGSKHNQYETKAAQDVCDYYGLQYELIDLSNIATLLKSDLLKSGGDIPEGHYAASNMSKTVVPGRNTIFAAVLLGIAQSREADAVFMGIHSGDHTIYPDCRPQWFDAMELAMTVASEGSVTLRAPFLDGDKTSILELGFKLGTPYELTRTCYKDQPVACGKCGSCQERLEAFRNHGKPDPIAYETRDALPKA